MEWMAETGFSLGRPIPGTDERYWPVPPLGVIYRVEGRHALRVLRVVDSRQRLPAPVVRRITIDPDRMRGLPCIRDTRVTVDAVLGQLAAGQSVEQILSNYPYLEVEDILAAVAFAAQAAVGHRPC